MNEHKEISKLSARKINFDNEKRVVYHKVD